MDDTAVATLDDELRECRRILARHSKSFDLASRLFPRARRDEVAALYAWCRHCDDAIDLAEGSQRAQALTALRAELKLVYSGAAVDDPVLRCFQGMVRRRQIPIDYPSELLEGMAMDVRHVDYETLDDLLTYCWRVAGTVGLMMCHVMGVSDRKAAHHAAHLGIGMQLTNICRDVVEDWRLGRVYVPLALLEPGFRAGLPSPEEREATLPSGARKAFRPALESLLSTAERYYASADRGMAYLDPRSALAVRTARLVYAEIGRRIESGGCDVLAPRAVVPLTRKLQLVTRALLDFASDRRRWSHARLVAPDRVLTAQEAVRLGG